MKTFIVVMTSGNCGYTTFRIHRPGCKEIYKEERETHGHSWEVMAATPEAALDVILADQEADENPYPESEVTIVPCTKGA